MEHLFGKWLPDLPASVSDGISLPMSQLLKAQSLTAALRALPHRFSVELLYSGEAETEYGRRRVRDVFLKLDGTAVVQARSACSVGSAFWQNVLDCGTRPLGERLFQADLEGARSAFEFAVSDEGCGRYFAARRSRFSHHGEEMLLTEYFLPELKRFIG